MILYDKLKKWISALEPLIDVEDQEIVSGQTPHRLIDFILANEFEKYCKQMSLKNPTFEEMINQFDINSMTEYHYYLRPY